MLQATQNFPVVQTKKSCLAQSHLTLIVNQLVSRSEFIVFLLQSAQILRNFKNCDIEEDTGTSAKTCYLPHIPSNLNKIYGLHIHKLLKGQRRNYDLSRRKNELLSLSKNIYIINIEELNVMHVNYMTIFYCTYFASE